MTSIQIITHRILDFGPIRSLREKGLYHLLSANILGQVLSFGTNLLIAKFLLQEELAEAKILQSYIILALVFAGYGFNQTVLKYCAEERSPENKEYLLGFSYFRTLLTTALTIFVIAILSLSGLLTGNRSMAGWLLVYAISLPFIVTTDILIVYLQATKRIKEMSAVQAANKAITFACTVLGTWLWGLPGFVIGTLASCIIQVFYPLWLVGWRFIKATPRFSPFKAPAGIYSLAWFSVLFSGITTLGQYGDVFILDHFVSDRAASGAYIFATLFILAAMQITTSVQAVLTPYFSLHDQDRDWFERNLRQNQAFMAAISLLVSAGIFGAAWLLVSFVYGSVYQASLGYLAVLLLRYVVFSSYAIIAAALTGLGLVKYNFYAVAIATPVGLLLSYLLQQPMGPMGIAWAQVIAALLTLAIQVLMLHRARKVHFTA